MSGKREYGDYQTPLDFSQIVCDYLLNVKKLTPTTIIEPTCGIGNFIDSSLVFNAEKYIGIEINDQYCIECKSRFQNSPVQIVNEDFFKVDLSSFVHPSESTLIIGNPPWVTSSTLSILNSDNLPHKANIKGLKGIDAITGSSNFDICEYIILQLINTFQNTNTSIAMLCKTSVARNIFAESIRRCISYHSFEIVEFDANKVFHINANACLLYIQLSTSASNVNVCSVKNIESPDKTQYTLSCIDGKFSRINTVSSDNFDGHSCFEWRQGIKHDCSKIMELHLIDGVYYNGLNEPVDIEPDLVYPLIKSSMFKEAIKTTFSRHVIVTQTATNEPTSKLSSLVPKTWAYLQKNDEYFNKRKSSIYKNAPPFSMFGVGQYTFCPYKVGVSGFYKKPLFSLLYSQSQQPIMVDDTSYFLCFETYNLAYIAMLILNSPRVQEFLISITFADSKRPYTKKVLQRIDFSKIVASIDYSEIKDTEHSLALPNYATQEMYSDFSQLVSKKSSHTFQQQQTSLFHIS